MSSLFESPCRRVDMEWALSYYGPLKLLDLKGRDLRTPLHFAVTQDDPKLIHRLLDLGKAAPPCTSLEQASTRHLTCWVCCAVCVCWFVLSCVCVVVSGADAFVRDRFGQSPLDLAKAAGQGEAALAIARNMQIQVVRTTSLT